MINRVHNAVNFGKSLVTIREGAFPEELKPVIPIIKRLTDTEGELGDTFTEIQDKRLDIDIRYQDEPDEDVEIEIGQKGQKNKRKFWVDIDDHGLTIEQKSKMVVDKIIAGVIAVLDERITGGIEKLTQGVDILKGKKVED